MDSAVSCLAECSFLIAAYLIHLADQSDQIHYTNVSQVGQLSAVVSGTGHVTVSRRITDALSGVDPSPVFYNVVDEYSVMP